MTGNHYSIESFTMTKGVILDLSGLATGTTVNLLGDVEFAVSHWEGPLFRIGTSSDTGTFIFNGNGVFTNLDVDTDPDMNRRQHPQWTGCRLLGWLGRKWWCDQTCKLRNIPYQSCYRSSPLRLLWSTSATVGELSRTW